MTKTIEEDNKRIGSVTRKGKKEKKLKKKHAKKRQKEREAKEKTKAIKHVKKNNTEEREENTQLSMVIELKGGDRGRGKDKANDEEQKIKKRVGNA